MRISDWSSDVCSSDLKAQPGQHICHLLKLPTPSQRHGGSTPLGRGEICPSSTLLRSTNNFAGSWFRFRSILPWLRRFLISSKKIGRASCRERVCQFVSISVVAVSLKKKTSKHNTYSYSLQDKILN